MNDRVRNQAVERKVSLLQNIKRKHEENIQCCKEAYADHPAYLEACKKAAERSMFDDMIENLKK